MRPKILSEFKSEIAKLPSEMIVPMTRLYEKWHLHWDAFILIFRNHSNSFGLHNGWFSKINCH